MYMAKSSLLTQILPGRINYEEAGECFGCLKWVREAKKYKKPTKIDIKQ